MEKVMKKGYKITVGLFNEAIGKFHRADIDLFEESMEGARNSAIRLCQITQDMLCGDNVEVTAYCNANERGNSFVVGLQRDGRQYPIVAYEIKPVKIVSAEEAIDMGRWLGNNMR